VQCPLDIAQLLVRDNLGNPMGGIVVTFAASTTSGAASATFPSGNTAVTAANGQASVTAIANGTAGTFTVRATAPGVTGGADFALTNALNCARANAVSFTPITHAPKQTLITSNTVTVSGLGTSCTAAASVTGGAYKIVRGGTTITSKASVGFSTAPQTVQDGDTITLEQTTSDRDNVATTVTLTLDGVQYLWSATTAAAQATAAEPIPLLPEREPMRSLVLILLAMMLGAIAVRGLSVQPDRTRRFGSRK
jgi:hypothetical protein